jgi:hypothetical protein
LEAVPKQKYEGPSPLCSRTETGFLSTNLYLDGSSHTLFFPRNVWLSLLISELPSRYSILRVLLLRTPKLDTYISTESGQVHFLPIAHAQSSFVDIQYRLLILQSILTAQQSGIEKRKTCYCGSICITYLVQFVQRMSCL